MKSKTFRKHFIKPIIGLSLLVLMMTILFNAVFIPKIYQKSQIKTNQEFANLWLIDNQKLSQDDYAFFTIDADHFDESAFNEQVRLELRRADIPVSKLWFSNEDFDNLDGVETKVIKQENASLISSYFIKDGNVHFVFNSIPRTSALTQLYSQYFTLSIGVYTLLLVLIIYIVLKKANKSLDTIDQKAKDALNNETVKFEGESDILEIQSLEQGIATLYEHMMQSKNEVLAQSHHVQVFSANLSHELKTSSAILRAYVDGIKSSYDDGTFIDKIDHQIDVLDETIQTSLRYLKVEMMNPQWRYDDPLKILIKAHQTRIEYLSDLVLNCDSEASTVMTDAYHLDIIFSNLLTNAYKYAVDRVLNLKIETRDNQIIFTFINEIKEESKGNTVMGLQISELLCEKLNIEYAVKIDAQNYQTILRFQASL